jgi:serine/threonine protein phosphatase PrpC
MPELVAQAASAQHIGRRSRQEDAMIAQFPQDGPGLAVLSDGMGGHDDGDLASRILVSEMFGELFLSAARPQSDKARASARFIGALDSANTRLGQHIGAGCISDDTGGTLLSVSVEGNCLRWLSVGDSPLYLCRGDRLQRLNEVHSMAVQLDLLVRNGAMTADAARSHPHRHCLTSAVTGKSVPRIDCPEESLTLEPGDVILLASDGLNVLDDDRICAVTRQARDAGCAAIARALLASVRQQNATDQDNVSLIAIRIDAVDPAARAVAPVRAARPLDRALARLSRLLRPGGLRGLRDAGSLPPMTGRARP